MRSLAPVRAGRRADDADPPLHTRLRDAIKREFAVGAVRARLERWCAPRCGAWWRTSAPANASTSPSSSRCHCPRRYLWLARVLSRGPRELVGWFEAMLERAPGQVELPAAALTCSPSDAAYILDALRARRRRSRDAICSGCSCRPSGPRALSEDEVLGSATSSLRRDHHDERGPIASSLLHLDRFADQRRLLRARPSSRRRRSRSCCASTRPCSWLTRIAARDVSVRGRTDPEREPGAPDLGRAPRRAALVVRRAILVRRAGCGTSPSGRYHALPGARWRAKRGSCSRARRRDRRLSWQAVAACLETRN